MDGGAAIRRRGGVGYKLPPTETGRCCGGSFARVQMLILIRWIKISRLASSLCGVPVAYLAFYNRHCLYDPVLARILFADVDAGNTASLSHWYSLCWAISLIPSHGAGKTEWEHDGQIVCKIDVFAFNAMLFSDWSPSVGISVVLHTFGRDDSFGPGRPQKKVFAAKGYLDCEASVADLRVWSLPSFCVPVLYYAGRERFLLPDCGVLYDAIFFVYVRIIDWKFNKTIFYIYICFERDVLYVMNLLYIGCIN